jgi:hypothetical protein
MTGIVGYENNNPTCKMHFFLGNQWIHLSENKYMRVKILFRWII